MKTEVEKAQNSLFYGNGNAISNIAGFKPNTIFLKVYSDKVIKIFERRKSFVAKYLFKMLKQMLASE
jgi:hypothetical protein